MPSLAAPPSPDATHRRTLRTARPLGNVFRGLPLALLGLTLVASASPADALPAHPPADASMTVRALSTARGDLAPSEAQIRELRLRLGRWRGFPDVLAPAGMSPGGSRSDARGAPPRLHGLRSAAAVAVPETIRVALLRVDFRTDRGGGLSTGDGHFDLGAPDPLAPPIDRPPHDRAFYLSHLEALSRYYDAQSQGHHVVIGEVWPLTPNGAYSLGDMADFGPWAPGGGLHAAAVRLFRAALFAADSQSIALGDRIPWDHYDRFDIIHAGSDLQSDLSQDSPEDIPTLTLVAAGEDAVVFPDSANRPIDQISFIPESASQDGFYAALNGVVAHENGHNLFGLGDVDDAASGRTVAGYWSLMDAGGSVGAIVQSSGGDLFFATGLLPPGVDPLQRQSIMPTAATEAALGDTLVLRAIERNDDIRRVTMSSDEYLLLENRFLTPSDSVTLDVDPVTHVILGPKTPDRFEYDALLPGGGVLIWHVDAAVIQAEGAINADSTRRGLEVLEGDGLQDLGDPASPYALGAPTDPWYVGNATILDDASAPALRTHAGVDPHRGVKVLDPPLAAMRVLVAGAPQVTVLFPNGGESLVADGDVMLVWNASGMFAIVSVELEISRDHGGTWETIAASTPNTGGYVWHVTRPGTPAGAALLRVTATDAAGFHGNDRSDGGFAVQATNSVGQAGVELALGTIGPNPAGSAPVRIGYSVGRETAVRLSVLDVQGRVRAVLVDGVLRPGRYEARWDHGAEAPAGLYFVAFQASGRTCARRVVVTH